MNEQQGLDPMFQENGSQWMEGGLASEPLNVYTAKTFGWMFLGLLVTFGTAIAFSAGGGPYYLLTMGMPAVFALAIAEIVVVMVLSARLHKLSIGAARGLFFAYAVLNGITFSAVFFAYCCFSERMRKLFRKNEKNVLRFCNKKAKEKRRLQRVKKPM